MIEHSLSKFSSNIFFNLIMKPLSGIIFFCVVLSLVSSKCFSQAEEKDCKKFNFLLNPGFTIHTDGNIYHSDGILEVISVDYLELGISYKISKKTEIGLSLGKNEFTFDSRIYDPNDSSIFVDSKIFRKCNWLSLDFNFYTRNDWFIGLKLGVVQPVYGFSETLVGVQYGKELLRFDDFFWKFNIQYLARISIDEFTVYSNQLNFLTGLGFTF